MIRSLLYLFLFVFMSSSAIADEARPPIWLVHSILDTPAGRASFARAKLAVDKFADPSIDETAILAELDGMAATVRKMLAAVPVAEAATDMGKMKALRAFLYEPGWWNEAKPFQYDLSNGFEGRWCDDKDARSFAAAALKNEREQGVKSSTKTNGWR